MKIIGIGLNRTGTKTLGESLRKLGFNHLPWSPEPFYIYINRGLPGLEVLLDQYDSFEDWPWPLIYREIDIAYPGCKFILTRRKSADIWYRSLCKHAMRTGPTSIRQHIYGYAMPGGHPMEHTAFYNRHLEAAHEYFRDRQDDLLEVCWEEGDGWREVAEFLGRPIPDLPFPHKNKSPNN